MGDRPRGARLVALLFGAIGLLQFGTMAALMGTGLDLQTFLQALDVCLDSSEFSGEWHFSGMAGLPGIYLSDVGYGVLALAIGVGLWRVKRWGWWWAVAYLTLGTLSSLNTHGALLPIRIEGWQFLVLLLPVLMLIYLVHKSVREAYLDPDEPALLS